MALILMYNDLCRILLKRNSNNTRIFQCKIATIQVRCIYIVNIIVYMYIPPTTEPSSASLHQTYIPLQYPLLLIKIRTMMTPIMMARE